MAIRGPYTRLIRTWIGESQQDDNERARVYGPAYGSPPQRDRIWFQRYCRAVGGESICSLNLAEPAALSLVLESLSRIFSRNLLLALLLSSALK